MRLLRKRFSQEVEESSLLEVEREKTRRQAMADLRAQQRIEAEKKAEIEKEIARLKREEAEKDAEQEKARTAVKRIESASGNLSNQSLVKTKTRPTTVVSMK